MDWSNVIEKNFAAILVLSGTLLGAAITAGIGMWASIRSRRIELENKKLEWQREYRNQKVIEPFISYLDEVLRVMDNALFSLSTGAIADLNGVVKLFDKVSTMKVRVRFFRDNRLVEPNNEFHDSIIRFSKLYLNRQKQQELLTLSEHAADISAAMFRQLESLVSMPLPTRKGL